MQEKKALNVEIGNRIRISRERAGLTQEQLAEKINRSAQFISTIERGVAGASLDTIITICDTLNTSTEWLLRGREASFDANMIASKIVHLSAAQLSAIDHLTDAVLELLRASK